MKNFLTDWTNTELAGQTYDRVSLAGSTKNLPEILNQVDISVRLHAIKTVYLIHHEDCGAYASENFPNSETEHVKHSSELNKAKAAILDKHPNLEVATLFLHLNGDFEKIS